VKPLEPATDPDDYQKAMEHVHETVSGFHIEHQANLPVWVVFGPGTTDYPGLYLARMWLTIPTMQRTTLVIRANSLAEIRQLLPDGLIRQPRFPQDDANIIETWM
jgi:hypothetical protein